MPVITVTTIDFNGVETEIGRHIDGLTPGQFDRAREILPNNLYNIVQAIWTPDVIATWEVKHPELQQDAS